MKKAQVRNGQKLRTLARGDARRLSDARNAWRKMTPAQRREFTEWMATEGLTVAK